jgi:hypothetical protein
MGEALITGWSVVSSVVGLVGLNFYRGGLENMLVSIKLSCGTSGTRLLWERH